MNESEFDSDIFIHRNKLYNPAAGTLISGLKPLSIGSVYIGFPAIQAPLSGYSDRPQRYITQNLREYVSQFPAYDYLPENVSCSVLGAAATVAEVMLDQFVITVKKSVKVNQRLGLTNSEHPCGAQIMGAIPEEFPPAALRLVQSGFDWIDLNFACPVKKVLGRKRGGFLLSEPETALKMIALTRDALPDSVPLTIKLRKGYDSSSQSEDNFYKILDGAFRLGVNAAAIHGRTVLERYSGTADWDFIANVKRHLGDKTVLGCGDLFTAQTCINRIIQTKIDGVCIARGAIGNPWIFPAFNTLALGLPQPQEPSFPEQAAVLAEHFNRCVDLYGERRTCSIIRKFGIKHAQQHPKKDDLIARFVTVKSKKDWFDILDEFYLKAQ